jgi:hypothetical protein
MLSSAGELMRFILANDVRRSKQRGTGRAEATVMLVGWRWSDDVIPIGAEWVGTATRHISVAVLGKYTKYCAQITWTCTT